MKQIRLTSEGLAQCEQELETLKTVKRPEISEKIKVALSFGDLSENSEYDEAKNEQAKVEARIAELEAILKQAVVIGEDELTTETVNMGSKVTILNTANKAEKLYQIVGSAEVKPREGKISDESPIGMALIGHKKGDTVSVETPGGMLHFEIINIEI